jgi:CDP-2,3-bis-(O-geranylgeranyl)-sn-glycerol synthase
MSNLLLALWFFWPAAIGNGLAVVANRVPVLQNWETPMDFGLSHRGKRIFGDNKTWRGFTFGVFMACVMATLQYYIWLPSMFAGKSLGFMVLLGGMLGAGALIGDAVESFIKRQFDIKAGASWFPFDQLDYIFGGILFSSLLIRMPWQVYAWVIFLYFGIHLVTVYFFYKVGIRDKPI